MRFLYLFAQIDNPFPVVSGEGVVKSILSLVFKLAGALAVIFVAYGGFKYIISRGEPQATARAKDTILYAVIGLVVALLANVIVAFVLNWLGTK